MGLFVQIKTEVLTDVKFLEAGAEASWMYVAGLCWSKYHMTDGAVPRAALAIVGANVADPEASAQRLVDAGLWSETNNGWTVGIERWGRHQQTRAQIEGRRESDRKRKGIHAESTRNPSGIQMESTRNQLGIHAESTRNPSGIRSDSAPQSAERRAQSSEAERARALDFHVSARKGGKSKTGKPGVATRAASPRRVGRGAGTVDDAPAKTPKPLEGVLPAKDAACAKTRTNKAKTASDVFEIAFSIYPKGSKTEARREWASAVSRTEADHDQPEEWLLARVRDYRAANPGEPVPRFVPMLHRWLRDECYKGSIKGDDYDIQGKGDQRRKADRAKRY